MTAWSKEVLGWANVTTLAPDAALGVLTLDAVETSGDVIRIDAMDGSGDYLLLEPVGADALEDGAVVVVRLGGRPTFHRFSRNGEGQYLQALQPSGASPELQHIEDPSTLDLVGRVAALYRRIDAASVAASLTTH